MKDIMTAPFMVEMIRTTTEMYRHGWDERNGGNVSLLLEGRFGVKAREGYLS